MTFFGMGPLEMTVILVVALIIFGPGKLPEVAGQVGKAVRDFRRMTTDLQGEFEKTVGLNEIRQTVQSEISGVKSQVNSATSSVKKDLAGTKSSATAAKSSTAKSTTTKSSTATATKATATTTKTGTATKSVSAKATSGAGSTPSAPAVASKRDPLADVSFMDDDPPKMTNGSGATSVSGSAAATASIVEPTLPSHDTNGSGAPSDAIARARLRRQSAGYNRRPS